MVKGAQERANLRSVCVCVCVCVLLLFFVDGKKSEDIPSK
jgi:hypothetical protein